MVDCYADLDFVGLWGHENSQDPICARSRTGFVATFANFTILWVSKLQKYIAISTLHSEYVTSGPVASNHGNLQKHCYLT